MSFETSGNRPIIFYGAGGYAMLKFNKWKAAGLLPVCFADTDEKKHYTKFAIADNNYNEGEEYEILSLNAAIERYPDYLLYLSVGCEMLRDVTDFLVERGIPKERINFADSVEWRRGCWQLGKQIVFNNSLSTCCTWEHAELLELSNSFKEDFARYSQYCKRMLNALRSGLPTSCDGCAFLREGFWEIEPEIELLVVCTTKRDYCNFKCIYCFEFSRLPKDECEKRRNYLMALIQHMSEISDDPAKINVSFAVGELSISPYCDELVDCLRKSGMKIVINSNASVYKESIVELLRDCRGTLHTSPDAGTASTFTKIKGIDCFSQVVENIGHYAINGVRIELKYIILESINDNELDICCFLDIAERVGAKVFLSSDTSRVSMPLSTHAFDMCLFFLNECKSRGFSTPAIVWENFHPHDARCLEKFTHYLR
jgi:uncharacterized radical SAM superfamily Fe-S cluster-containing enzyme